MGLTQSELAVRAEVSRQLVAAVESGRHAPAVDAAIRLARALGASVEELFAPTPPSVLPALGGQLRDRAAVRVARVGEQLVAAEVADHGVAGAGWASADGCWERGALRLHPGASLDGLAIAGCEPAFGIAEQMLAGLGARSLLAISAPTSSAVTALSERRVHGAVVHGPDGSLPVPPLAVRRIQVARWRVGLGAPRGAGDELETVLAGTPVIQREAGAAVQQAFRRTCRRLGTAPPRAPMIASGHIEAARLAASHRCAGLTTEPAARVFELQFLPFEDHTVELWLDAAWLAHPGAQALQELLVSSAFTQRVARRGGYDLTGSGEIVRS